MRRWQGQAAGILLAALVQGCASYSSIRYAPSVQDVELRDESNALQARIVVAWRGIQDVEIDDRDTYEFRFRLRVENASEKPFIVAPVDFVLLDGALRSIGPARVSSPTESVDPGKSATFEVGFPVHEGKRPDDYELSALNLRVTFQDGRWSWSADFQRVEYEPYGPSFGFGVGVGL
jgi:hypothetical protein